MGNHANLVALPNMDVDSVSNQDRCYFRYAKNTIPLFWWALFQADARCECVIDTSDGSGTLQKTKVTTFLVSKDEAAKRISSLAARPKKGFPPESTEMLLQLEEAIKKSSGQVIQLDCAELFYMMETEDFDAWLEDGIAFGEYLRKTQTIETKAISIELQDLCFIYELDGGLYSDDWEGSLVGWTW